MVRLYAKLARIDPLTKPDWRFERLLQLAEAPGGRPTRLDDEFVRAAYPFFRALKSGGKTADELLWRNPDLFVAFRLYESRTINRTISIQLENRLLADEALESIAKKSRTTPGAVRWYSLLFFDVRPRLKPKDWIFAKAIMPEIARAYDRERQPRATQTTICQARLDPSLRVYAYLGGPLLYDVLLFNAPIDVRPMGYGAVPDALDEHTKTAMRAKAVLAIAAMSTSSFDVVEIARLSIRLMKLKKDEGDDKKRFLAEAVEAIEESQRKRLAPWGLSATRDEEPKFDDATVGDEAPKKSRPRVERNCRPSGARTATHLTPARRDEEIEGWPDQTVLRRGKLSQVERQINVI